MLQPWNHGGSCSQHLWHWSFPLLHCRWKRCSHISIPSASGRLCGIFLVKSEACSCKNRCLLLKAHVLWVLAPLLEAAPQSHLKGLWVHQGGGQQAASFSQNPQGHGAWGKRGV